jgi:FixJ family two-component response regulator
MHRMEEIGFPNGSQPNGCAVCLLDDDPSALRGINRLLSSAGWVAKPFDNPQSFLEYVQTHRPKVAVLDILMPVMNGLEVQRRLRQISPSTKVVILTSMDDPSVRSKAMEAGASAFFLKPVDSEEFLQAIKVTVGDN